MTHGDYDCTVALPKTVNCSYIYVGVLFVCQDLF